MSGVSNRLITHIERDTMKTPMDLPTLQKEYDAMLKVAKRSLDNNVDLSPAFERELTLLMRAVKSLGGKV